jgi:SAM-dependent methyltransferase
MTTHSAAQRWADALNAWAIPRNILDQAPETPWIHPPALFQIPEDIPSTPSHERAREAMPAGGLVLDVGCGGGIAAFAICPPATRAFGVDDQREMLEMFTANAAARGVDCEVVEGLWPDVASQTPIADVVTAHHVVYNVRDIRDFLSELNAHASQRVVLEMPQQHPLSDLTELWKHFWKLERPTEPTPALLMEVLAEMGIAANCELWEGELRAEQNLDDQTRFVRIRLCLTEGRDKEIRELLTRRPRPHVRPLATIWWDVQ